LFVVSGFPNEVMTIKDNKTYLNRNIIAHNIEPGTFSSKETTQQTTTTTYHDVAPVTAPICETPEIPQPAVETIEKPAVSTEPTYTVSSPSVASQLVDAPDDLPF
jgi:hypothetical protein